MTPDEACRGPQPGRFHYPRYRLAWWIRLGLLLLAGSIILVFLIAWRIDPYKDGKVWLIETHRQLGLAPCTFKVWTGLPCPSCGMTSSFALLVRGDLVHSLQANVAGTALALLLAVLLPWSLVSTFAGRWIGIRSVERAIVWLALGFLVLMFLRWFLVLGLAWWSGE